MAALEYNNTGQPNCLCLVVVYIFKIFHDFTIGKSDRIPVPCKQIWEPPFEMYDFKEQFAGEILHNTSRLLIDSIHCKEVSQLESYPECYDFGRDATNSVQFVLVFDTLNYNGKFELLDENHKEYIKHGNTNP